MEVYAADLEAYTAASEAYRQRAEGPSEKVLVEFQPVSKMSKDLETDDVAWNTN